jgi:hypothetical protein
MESRAPPHGLLTPRRVLHHQGLRALASELAQLREATNTEMERSVFANYSAFIRRVKARLSFPPRGCAQRGLTQHARLLDRTAKEIADLQTDLSRCRELLHGISGVHAALSNSASSSQANGNGAQLPEGGVTRCDDDERLELKFRVSL